MQEQDLIPHLFKSEYRKIVSVLCKLFGIQHIEIAEDIVSDTFLLAAETWGLKGLPSNPTAWLYTVSKNKVLDLIKRDKLFKEKIIVELQKDTEMLEEFNVDLSNENIIDSQLKMMFALSHPSITKEAQIGLSLNILCGFGADEIADAFLSNKETIYKRLARAKEKLRLENVPVAFPANSEISVRLDTVLSTLYLLFNEGYYSVSNNIKLRKELCLEAMRLNLMLVENELCNQPNSNALLALMCFHSSRFEARINNDGQSVLYDDQVEENWNKELIQKGEYYLNQSSKGKKITKYHIEAGIAYWHTKKNDNQTKWESILQLYNKLLQIEYSPIAALNRTYALSKANGKQEAIIEAEKLKLTTNHLYFALLANLYTGIDNNKASEAYIIAINLAKSVADKEMLLINLNKLKNNGS